MEALLLKMAEGQGLPFVMTIIALVWMQQMHKASLESLNLERNGHLQTLCEQIKKLEEAINDCERDRKELWAEFIKRDNERHA
jgi:hypothetical protein